MDSGMGVLNAFEKATGLDVDGDGRVANGRSSMKQSRLMSLVEAITNIVIGYGIAVATQLIVFPWFGLPARISDAVAIGAIYTGISIVRSYALRRVFETLRETRESRHQRGWRRLRSRVRRAQVIR